MKIFALIIGLFLLNTVEAKQKFYKWTDADGNIHYSETKPKNQKVSEIKVHTSQPSITTNKQNNTEHTDDSENTENTEKSADQQAVDEYNKKEKARAEIQQNKSNCKIAKKNLATLQQTTRVRKIDPKSGEYIRMDDSQRLESLAAAKKLIKDVCQ